MTQQPTATLADNDIDTRPDPFAEFDRRQAENLRRNPPREINNSPTGAALAPDLEGDTNWRFLPTVNFVRVARRLELMLSRGAVPTYHASVKELADKISAEVRESENFKRLAHLRDELAALDKQIADNTEKEQAAALQYKTHAASGSPNENFADWLTSYATELEILKQDRAAFQRERNMIPAAIRELYPLCEAELKAAIDRSREEVVAKRRELMQEAKTSVAKAINDALQPLEQAMAQMDEHGRATGPDFVRSLLGDRQE